MTENNVAAQAGDEPMRAALNVASQCRATAFHSISFKIEVDGGNGLLHELLLDAACAIEALAAQVSPRATADVERECRVISMTPGMGRIEVQFTGCIPEWAELGNTVNIATTKSGA